MKSTILSYILISSAPLASVLVTANQFRIPAVLCKSPSLSGSSSSLSSSLSSSSPSLSCNEDPSNLLSSPALQLSGGGSGSGSGVIRNQQESRDDENDSEDDDDEFILSFAEESDIMVEIRGGGGVGVATLNVNDNNVNGSQLGQEQEHGLEHGFEHGFELEHEHEHKHGQGGDLQTHAQPNSQPHNHSYQPLRISTYRKGIRQLKHSERREKRRLKRIEKLEMRHFKKMEKRERREEKKSHKVYAKKLKNRNNLNIRRKVLHAGFGLFFATLNQVIPRKYFLQGMTVLTSATLVMELLRYKKGCGWMNDALHFVLGGTLRKQEMEGKFTGSFYYFLGVTLTSYLFPQSCASLGICQLALADPSASFFGRQTRHVYWSRIENGFFGIGRNKGLLGFLGGAAFCFPFNYHVLNVAKFGGSNLIPGGQSSVALASIALGLAGAFADLCVPTPALTMPKKIMGIPMPAFHVDDNVVVPIVSGYACTKIFERLGWTQGVDLAKFILF